MGRYSYKAEDDFDTSRMEAMVKMAERFNNNGTLDSETLKKIKGLTESNAPFEND